MARGQSNQNGLLFGPRSTGDTVSAFEQAKNNKKLYDYMQVDITDAAAHLNSMVDFLTKDEINYQWEIYSDLRSLQMIRDNDDKEVVNRLKFLAKWSAGLPRPAAFFICIDPETKQFFAGMSQPNHQNILCSARKSLEGAVHQLAMWMTSEKHSGSEIPGIDAATHPTEKQMQSFVKNQIKANLANI